jgi:hypothetical protein
MEPLTPKPEGLGSLARSARGKQLKQARTILFVVGVMQIIGSIIFISLAPGQIKQALDAEITKAGGPGRVDPAAVQQVEANALRITQIVNGGFLLMGVLFIVFGFILPMYPVPVAVTSLVVFLGAQVIVALFNPASLAQGIIIKAIFVVALAKAVQAALADQRERRAELSGEAAPL